MFSGLKKIFGAVTVEVRNGIVRVEGIPSEVIANDIRKIWKTSRVDGNLFNYVGSYSFTFHEFFCIEMVYALTLLAEDRKTRSNRRTLVEIIRVLREKTWLSRADMPLKSSLNRARLDEMTLQPLPPQEGFFDAYELQKHRLGLTGGVLAGAAGSGKTYMSLALMNMLERDLVIVIAPSNAVHEVWVENLQSKFKKPPKYWTYDSKKLPDGDERFLIFNFEALKRVKEVVKGFDLSRLGIILDESHNFNELTSQRTQLFIELCREFKCQDVLWSSGTPIKAITLEAIPIIRTIDPLFTPECEARFKAIYGVSSQRANDMLAHRLNGLMYKIEKKELGLLAPIFREIKVKAPNAQYFTLKEVSKRMFEYTQERLAYYASRKKEDDKFFYDVLDQHFKTLNNVQRGEYQAYARALATVIQYGGDARACSEEMRFCNRYEARNILPGITDKATLQRFKETKTIVKYVKLKVQGECLGRVVGRARIDAHIAMAPLINYGDLLRSTEKKVLVYTSFTEVLVRLQEHFKELDLNALYVYAETNKNLSPILDKFKNDDTANPLVATYKSLSTAVPMTMADVMVLVDAPFRDYQLQQTVSRISRLGANTQTYVYTATLDTGDEANISTRSVDILKWSQQQVATITGIRSPFEITDDMEQVGMALEERFIAAFESFEDGVEAPAGLKPAFLSWQS